MYAYRSDESTHEIIFVKTIVLNIYVKIKHRRKQKRKKANFEFFSITKLNTAVLVTSKIARNKTFMFLLMIGFVI